MLKYIFLGIVQGLTEFLPVSSSAHLVILGRILGILEDQVAIAAVLHMGTAFSLVVFFFKDFLSLFRNLKLLFYLFVTTVITVIIALTGRDFFERLFNLVKPAAFALIITGIILILTKKFMRRKRNFIALGDALILGLAQGIAIIPGISRSGITVSMLLFRGLDVKNSFRYSFLAALPVIFGAAIFEAKKIGFAFEAATINLCLGFLASFLFGILSLFCLREVLSRARLYYFGYYCIAVGLLSLIFVR